MIFVSKSSKLMAASAILLAVLLASCSETAAPQPNIIQRVEGEQATPPPSSGFLGSDYALLKPPPEGSGQTAMLVYTNASVNFSSYRKIIIAPVTFWANDDSKVSAADQQTLCNYMYNLLTEEFSKNFTIVNQPGPGVAKFSRAISDATSATSRLRTVSVIVPQAHALNLLKAGLTGTYAFVGSATGEAKLTDSITGQLLAAWADERFGTAAVRNATVFQWGDAENAMTYWAKGLDQRLLTSGVHNTGPLAAD
jgi:hypothetical protein